LPLSYLHSFPTRRSSDLASTSLNSATGVVLAGLTINVFPVARPTGTCNDHCPAGLLNGSKTPQTPTGSIFLKANCPGTVCEKSPDRKSTRLNSSHDQISY